MFLIKSEQGIDDDRGEDKKGVAVFADKNSNGATEIYSAADFADVEIKDLYKFYKIGKLNATPNIGSIVLQNNKAPNTNG